MGITRRQLDRCVQIAKEFGVKKLILFGSAAESPGTARDIDLACEGVHGWRIFELGGRMEEAVRVNVDLIPLSPATRFSRHVAARGRVIYERKRTRPRGRARIRAHG